MKVFIIFNMCRHCDPFLLSQMLCDWLLYTLCVVTVIQLYVTQSYVSGYYNVHVSLLWHTYM